MQITPDTNISQNNRPFFQRLALNTTLILACVSLCGFAFAQPQINHDPEGRLITLSDGPGHLVLRLNYNAGCRLDQIRIMGREVAAETGTVTGIRIGNETFSSQMADAVKVNVRRGTVTVGGIKFGPVGREIQETWKFTPRSGEIIWQIARAYPELVTAEDIAFPEWNFSNLSTWTGGLLDNGGVVWNKYLDRANATYGGHFGTVTFWNAQSNDCLRIVPKLPVDSFGAGRFSRQPNDVLTFRYAISREELETKHGQNRFLGDRQDLWKPFQVGPAKVTAEFVLQALPYDKTYGRGTFEGVEGDSVRDLLNTVARYGVIDAKLTGANGWRSGYICLHEPFFAQIAAAVNSADYTANLSAFLDNARDHAIEPNGRVKSRWTYGPWDAMPGSYDDFGFYEAQWGYLLDSQTSYVLNVAEQFCLTGDRAWLAQHKDSCERALAFLTQREVEGSGLVAMMTDSHKQNRGSDWIDIIWASYKNAFVNAQLYAALNLWADAEDALDDTRRAESYRAFAARLKASFNQPTAEGGFWDAKNQWYVYWLDKDGSVHGNNLVTPVNFAAIAYGLCDDPARQKAILDRIETEMEKEKLFYWPLSFFPYEPGEGAGSNYPFPKYENGDIFLSWGELGVRAYAGYKPELALKYVRNTLDRYAQDGLSFQRYLRNDQRGEGDDILANNCMPVVGLYRNIYGIQPKPNRLYLDPHLTRELTGTQLRYNLRGQHYELGLGLDSSSITAGNCSVLATHPFGINATDHELQYFHQAEQDWTLSARPPKNSTLKVEILKWSASSNTPREWMETSSSGTGKTAYQVRGLVPGATYRLEANGQAADTLRANQQGEVKFRHQSTSAIPTKLTILPAD